MFFCLHFIVYLPF